MVDIDYPVSQQVAGSDRTMLAVGRVAMACLFVYSAVGKGMNFDGFAANLSNNGVPAATVLTALAILVEFGGGLFLAFGIKVRAAALLLVGFTVVATLLGHPFWRAGPEAMGNAIHALKNLSILGGLLAVVVAQRAVDGLLKPN